MVLTLTRCALSLSLYICIIIIKYIYICFLSNMLFVDWFNGSKSWGVKMMTVGHHPLAAIGSQGVKGNDSKSKYHETLSHLRERRWFLMLRKKKNYD